MGIAYESNVPESIGEFKIRAFPTYILFEAGAEKQRVEGVQLNILEEWIQLPPPGPGHTASLNQEALKELTENMGFALVRAQKGLLHGNNTVEGAVEWIMQHQDDMDIDEPLSAAAAAAQEVKAQSYKCNECGKILSNMANLELVSWLMS
jgi:hypothetical protein